MPKIYPITEFDAMTLPATLQIFKSIIPFMDYDMQRSISTVIRANELIHTMNFYKSPANCKVFKSCSSDFRISRSSSIQEILSNENILSMVLRYCPEETENMLNQLKGFLSMSDLFNVFHQNGSGAGGFTFDEKALLNPSQQKLYSQYIHELDQIDLSKK